jgi:amino acid adenylation domain-containing protein
MDEMKDRIVGLSSDKRTLLEDYLAGLPSSAAGGIPPRPRGLAPLPLSFAQQRLWFLDQFEPGNALYNIPAALRIRGPLDVAILERALRGIASRHEILRTTFPVVDGRPEQRIAVSVTIPVPVVDLRAVPHDQRDDEMRRSYGAETRRPFDLAAGPLFRAALVRLADLDHLVVVTFHHIVFDGWSIAIFERELLALLNAFTLKQPSPLAELPIQYADFALWQRRTLQGEHLEQLLSYWRRALDGAPPEIDLPIDRPRAMINRFRGASRGFTIAPAVAEPLRALARRESATVFMVLLAAFQSLLHRYSGHEDIVVGTTVANRTRSEVEPLIGFFVNSLVLRVDCSGRPTFREVLRRVREATLGAYAHQELPFERLVEQLRPERHLSRNPLFQVAFVLQNLPGAKDSGELSEVEGPVHHTSGTAKFDLTLAMTEGARHLRGGVEYNTDLFDATTIDRIIEHFRLLLNGIANDADRRIGDLPLLTAAERRIMMPASDGGHDGRADRRFDQIIAERARVDPGRMAIDAGGRTLTYRELDLRANQLAHFLRARGIGAEDVVATCLERSLDVPIVTAGIMRCGAAILPLDPSFPPARLGHMLGQAGARLALTHAEFRPLVPVDLPAVVLDGKDADAIAHAPTDPPAVDIHPEQLAWIIFTSGSTGQPKGVLVPHRGVGRLSESMRRTFGIAPDDRTLQFASLGFDASLYEMIMTFEAGAALVIERQAALLPGADLARLLRDRQITVASLSPSAWSAMPSDDLPALRIAIFAGEASSPELAGRWRRRRMLFNAYGPTECTIAASLGAVQHDGVPRLGQAVIGTTIHVLDRNLSPVPTGCIGQIYLGGAGVGRGYAGRPDLTAERYLPDPFSERPGARMYRTGDLARVRPGGELEFVGRSDQQIKLRGFRIELGEIEAVLAEYPAIERAVVVVRRDGGGEPRLVAYLASSRPQQAGELRAMLRGRLPEHMIPAAFVALPALPLSPSGKIDRKALPAPDRLRPTSDRLVSPRNRIEERIAAIWCDVLALDQVSIDDSFFEIGGHSLLATQVIARIADAFRINVSLRALFLDPTVAGLAAAVEAASGASTVSASPPLDRTTRNGKLQLSFAQERLWFLDRLEPGSAFYTIPAALRLRGRVDLPALECALAWVVERHESLRTTFVLDGERPVQRIHLPAAVQLSVLDLGRLPEEERELAVARATAEEARRPFDLAEGPLLRTSVLRLGDRDHVLLITIHHIIADGWSVALLLRELNEAYLALARGHVPALKPLSLQYADFAEWQRRWLTGPVLADLVAWWRTELRGAPSTLELPADRSRPPVQLHRGAIRDFTLPNPLAQELRALAQREGVTVFMLLLAAFDVLLYRYTGRADLVVGTPTANRTRPELEALIGLFVNTLALRIDLSGRPTFRVLLARVRDTTLAALAHQDLPFEQLVEALQPVRDVSHNPIFQVMFAMQNIPGLAATNVDADDRARVAERPRDAGTGTAKFDLTLFMADTAAGMYGALEYDTDLFDGERIERMADHLRVLLGGIVDDVDAPIDALPLLTSDERARVLIGNVHDVGRAPLCLHELVRAQAARTPDAIALEFEDRWLSYTEMCRRALALAGELRKRGVGPEVVVGVACERSLEMVIAILGVLEAGGAYTPIDADHPAARIEHQLRSAGASLVLVHAPTRARLAAAVGAAGAAAIAVDDLPLEALPVVPLMLLSPDHLAYVIYTSGSTGEPKGVMNQHGPVCNRLQWMIDTHPCGPGDAVLQKTPITFDVSVWEMFWPLCSGARLVIARPGGHRDAQYLTATVAHRGITVLHFVPSMLRAFLEQPELERCKSLHRLFCSGEALGIELAERVLARLPVQLHNMYGPTEAAIEVSHWAYRREPTARTVPIGRPLPNARLYILDAGLAPTPIGVPGELYLGGTPVARGYCGRPDFTADRFVPDPFGAPGARMYRTGDRARVRADGAVEFLGRLDDQIKLRGLRVELGEIEAALRSHPAVREAVVIARETGPQDIRLIAYVVGDGTEPDALRRHLVARLPEYMVPTAFVPLEHLPLNPSGKVDRKALPIPDQPARLDRIGPRNPVEIRVATIWSDVLHIHTLDVRDRFFELGGNSLLATQVIARVNQAFSIELPLRRLFESAELGEFARAVADAAASGGAATGPRLLPLAGRDEADLLARIDELSDDEVAALLAEYGAEEGGDG